MLPSAVIIPVVTLSGPPAMLVWGAETLRAFSIASAAVFILLLCGLRVREYRRVYFSAALVVWLISGFSSFAVSA
jgi:hypothetical protein